MFNYVDKSFNRFVDQAVVVTKMADNFGRTQEMARDKNK
jgi:hypothetical protein